MNLQHLILSAAEYKILLIIPGLGAFPFATTDSLSYNIAIESEPVHVLGSENPIGIGRNARKYSGKLSMQMGEIAAIKLATGLKDMTMISAAVLTATSLTGSFVMTWSGVVINTEGLDVKSKDKQTICSLDWEGVGLN